MAKKYISVTINMMFCLKKGSRIPCKEEHGKSMLIKSYGEFLKQCSGLYSAIL
jgi:hypothetical protein